MPQDFKSTAKENMLNMLTQQEPMMVVADKMGKMGGMMQDAYRERVKPYWQRLIEMLTKHGLYPR